MGGRGCQYHKVQASSLFQGRKGQEREWMRMVKLVLLKMETQNKMKGGNFWPIVIPQKVRLWFVKYQYQFTYAYGLNQKLNSPEVLETKDNTPRGADQVPNVWDLLFCHAGVHLYWSLLCFFQRSPLNTEFTMFSLLLFKVNFVSPGSSSFRLCSP